MPQIYYTNDIEQTHISVCIHGISGAGKTTALGTFKDLSKVLIISTENGNLSLKNKRIAYTIVRNWAELRRVIQELKMPTCPFEIICFDSMTDFCELDFREKTTDVNGNVIKATKLTAYGEVGDDMRDILRELRYLNKDYVVIFQQERTTDSEGISRFTPTIVGSKAQADIPYYFDEVIALDVVKGDDGLPRRQFICQPDGNHLAKDRSGNLEYLEPANLQMLFDKIRRTTSEQLPNNFDKEKTNATENRS